MDSNTRKVPLVDCFEIKAANQDDKINFPISDKWSPMAVPFIGRSKSNNGVVDYVESTNTRINYGGVITVALDGSTGSTFYQHHNFCSGQNIWLLIPKQDKFEEFNPLIALYCVTTIRKAVVNYSYNLSLTKKRLEENIWIFLPMEVSERGEKVNTEYIKEQMRGLRNYQFIEDISQRRILEI